MAPAMKREMKSESYGEMSVARRRHMKAAAEMAESRRN